MKLFRKYLLKHSREFEVVNGRETASWLGYGFLGTMALVSLWALIGSLVLNRPGYQQFSGFMPVPAIKALGSLVLDTDFWSSVVASLCRIVVGLLVAFVLGMPFGLLIGYYRKLRLATNPSIQFLRMISPLAWMPIALLLFKSFESAIHFLIAVATIWPILLNTVLGVSRVNPQWINMARDQGAKDYHVILHIVIPASVPYVLTSLRLALGVAWIVLVPAEFLGVSSGLGYLINDARDTMEYDRLMAIILFIGALGYVLDGAIQLAQKRFNWVWMH